jgi:hypothetical protein
MGADEEEDLLDDEDEDRITEDSEPDSEDEDGKDKIGNDLAKLVNSTLCLN